MAFTERVRGSSWARKVRVMVRSLGDASGQTAAGPRQRSRTMRFNVETPDSVPNMRGGALHTTAFATTERRGASAAPASATGCGFAPASRERGGAGVGCGVGGGTGSYCTDGIVGGGAGVARGALATVVVVAAGGIGATGFLSARNTTATAASNASVPPTPIATKTAARAWRGALAA